MGTPAPGPATQLAEHRDRGPHGAGPGVPLAAGGTRSGPGVVEAGGGSVHIGEKERGEWRADLDPRIQAVRTLARAYDAHLVAADGMFAELGATTGPEYRAADGVHPTPAGHAALASAWLRQVA